MTDEPTRNPYLRSDGTFPSLHEEHLRGFLKRQCDEVPLGPVSHEWIKENVGFLMESLTAQPGIDPTSPDGWAIFAFGLDLGLQAGKREGFRLLLIKLMAEVLERIDNAEALNIPGDFDWDGMDWEGGN